MKNKVNQKKAKIKTSFTGGMLTNYSGLLPIYNFMSKIGLIEELSEVDIHTHHNIKYDTATIFSIIMLGILSGANRIKKIETFSRDPLIHEIFGLEDKIDEDTIGNRIRRFEQKQTCELIDVIGKTSRKVHKQLGTKEDILDLDSTVKTVYGNQEGTAKGYNPEKKGANSYHPLLGFLNSTRECILSWLRPGNTYTSNNTAGFIKQTFAMLEENIDHLLVRADSGFFDDDIISEIESRTNTDYIIKVKMKNLNSLLSSQYWESIPGMSDWQMTEFYYKCAGWDKERKFVAMRRIRKLEADGMLFPRVEYDYFCYVSNMYESPLFIHSEYGDRGTCENWIEAVKNQMFAGSLLTQDFWANEALWLASVMSYNVSVWMRALTDEKSWHEEPMTFRSWFIQLAGKIVRTGRKVYLKMYEAYYYKSRWLRIEYEIENLVFY